MNILPAEDKLVCRVDAQARPRTLSTWTVTGLSALLLGHRTVSTADTGGAAHPCPGEYGHMTRTWPVGMFYPSWPP